MKGKFITLEGCEGAGKSAQCNLLAEYFNKNNIDYILTREPGGTPVAEKIRSIILSPENKGMSYECETLLYAAARADHLSNKIIPALNDGKLVLCDRFLDSSLAYQAYARGLGTETVEKANFFAYENCMPDVTLFLDISPEDAFRRKGGVDKNDRIELEGAEFHMKVYKGYLALAEKYPMRFIKIPCMGNKYQTHDNIVSALKSRGIL
ncbi:MAG: dTMP kinase [Christensenellaceae bacterium]|nr:dTMP kinase [Christensenellaceae bacterium]MDD6927238.1 dTMP kinase [bacterium]